MLLNTCPLCNIYTLNDACPTCKKPTKSAHYKFKGLTDAPKDQERVKD